MSVMAMLRQLAFLSRRWHNPFGSSHRTVYVKKSVGIACEPCIRTAFD